MRACRASRWTRRASGARGTRAGADFSAHRGFPMSPVELESVLTCPLCGVSTRETMPTNACRWFHECAACHAIFQPLPGDCCVYCSYGTVKCPPVQQGMRSAERRVGKECVSTCRSRG